MSSEPYSPRDIRALFYLMKDFHDAEVLYEYVKYGLYIRGCLEVAGPYEFPGYGIERVQATDGFSLDLKLESIHEVATFRKHREKISNYAKGQLLQAYYTVVEYFVNNIYRDLVGLLELPNRFTATDLEIQWSEADRKAFTALTEVSALMTDRETWVKQTHNWDAQKKRLKVLGKYLDIDITGISAPVSDGSGKQRSVSYNDFCSARLLRHSYVHASGRFALFSQRLKNASGDIDGAIVAVKSFAIAMANAINQAIHDRGIVRDHRAGIPQDKYEPGVKIRNHDKIFDLREPFFDDEEWA